ncbi:MAG: tRNA-dihydrouridine synthase [Candidatus Pacebacteria bacterium]|nr:tRNA-dihydrouridine synthase [Candidatus Paceibacterota bacterium]
MKTAIKQMNNNDIVMGFWANLPKSFKILAPMADVTDAAFRAIVAKYSRMGKPGGGPDVLYTEFVAADGLFSDVGRPNLMHMFKYQAENRPIVAQIFSSDPIKMESAARLCVELGFDGIDLNMGCPERNICKQGAGSAMIQTPELAQEVILAAKRGAGNIPVSVKTRIGWTQNEIETWIPAILDCDVAAIILHGRTRKEMSKVPARWDDIARAAEIVRASGKPTKFVGNGDVVSVEQADEYTEKYQVDGVMIGRGIFGTPWLFDTERNSVSIDERLEIMLEHTRLFLKLLPNKNFNIMKKHYKAYVSGFDGARELRGKCMEANSYDEIEKHVYKFLRKKKNFIERVINIFRK